jgi:hypothetical protein
MASTRRDDLLRALPYARRYARALTGSQPRGDLLVAESLREMLAATDHSLTPRFGLYHWVTRRFDAGISTLPSLVGGLSSKQRQLLLLTALEEVSVEDAAAIVSLPHADAAGLLGEARDRLRASAATDVLIIEDEPIIAMDIEELVAGCGHRVVGVASTEAEAVRLAQATKPGLILADINLGLGGDGTSAVSRITRR